MGESRLCNGYFGIFQFWSFNIVSDFVFAISNFCVHNVLTSSPSRGLPEATRSAGARLTYGCPS